MSSHLLPALMYAQPILLLTGRKHSLGLKQEGCWLLRFLYCSETSVLFLRVQRRPLKRRAAETWHVAAQTFQLFCWAVWAAISGPGMCHCSPGHRTRDTLFITLWDARFRCLPLAPRTAGSRFPAPAPSCPPPFCLVAIVGFESNNWDFQCQRLRNING